MTLRAPLRYRRVLIALDGSRNAERILPIVRPVLAAHEATAVVAQVLSGNGRAPDAAARAYLRLLQGKLESRDIHVETVAPRGDPAFELLRLSERGGIDLVAMTTHGRGAWARMIFGSVAQKLLRATSVPLLLVRSLGRIPPGVRRILVPLDGSRRAEAALPHAAALARVFGAQILLLHVSSTPGIEAEDSKFSRWIRAETRRMERRFAEIRESLAPLTVETAIEPGTPALQIVRRAGERPGTLIALSSHGRTGIRRWAFGSVAEKVLHRSTVPLLIVKSFRPG